MATQYTRQSATEDHLHVERNAPEFNTPISPHVLSLYWTRTSPNLIRGTAAWATAWSPCQPRGGTQASMMEVYCCGWTCLACQGVQPVVVPASLHRYSRNQLPFRLSHWLQRVIDVKHIWKHPPPPPLSLPFVSTSCSEVEVRSGRGGRDGRTIGGGGFDKGGTLTWRPLPAAIQAVHLPPPPPLCVTSPYCCCCSRGG